MKKENKQLMLGIIFTIIISLLLSIFHEKAIIRGFIAGISGMAIG